MGRIGLKIALLNMALLAIVTSIAPAAAWDSAKIRNCTWCHGTSAQGYVIAPRLAGQQPAYLEKQIVDFRSHVRDNPRSKQYMWGAVAALNYDDARGLAVYFASIQPKPARDGNPNLMAMGRTIYLDGIPEANIVSCYACHGPNAEGVRDIPRLAGLGYFYLKARLEQWKQGYHSGGATPMPTVASQLGPGEIEALASYLSFVR